MAYVGKFPYRIKQASFNKGNIWILTLNNGQTHRIPASQIAGSMPKPGEEISKYIDSGLPMVKLAINPVKKTRKNPVEQDIGKSKYPHYPFDYSIQFDAGTGGWATVAGTNNLSYAKKIAHLFAKEFPERTIRVSSEK